MKPDSRRAIPSVDELLRELGDVGLSRTALVALVRRELAVLRRKRPIRGREQIITHLRTEVDRLCRSRLQGVINATGVLIHTNLGRSPLSSDAGAALAEIACNYNNLEYHLTTGERGGRGEYLEHNLAVLCGAEAAAIVNNCAAALVLILRHFASGERKQVIISRGELVQIGGGFRIPEILAASGAQLREVGTTNKTSLSDYSRALGKQSALILKVHRSNFYMDGFVESPGSDQIAELARKHRVPYVEDLGSGAIVDTGRIAGLEHEPTPAESLRHGVDLVCFSGDKLFGGPQAGIIAGRGRLIAKLKRDPFFRALRCDKLILAALQTTVDAYLSGPAERMDWSKVPVLRMLAEPVEALRARAERMVEQLKGLVLDAQVGSSCSRIGGGTLPHSTVQSITIDLKPRSISVKELAAKLRSASQPVIGYVSGNRCRLDLRTIFPGQDEALVRSIREAMAPDA